MKNVIQTFLIIIGVIWALPVTAVGAVLAMILMVLGWLRPLGWRGKAYVFVPKNPPVAALRILHSWLGITFGNIVILRTPPDYGDSGQRLLQHELEHVRQTMILGPLFPILYFGIMLVIWLFVRRLDPYFDSPFEIAARRAAGQYVDIWGMILKMRSRHQ
jgi:hypothetical protein